VKHPRTRPRPTHAVAAFGPARAPRSRAHTPHSPPPAAELRARHELHCLPAPLPPSSRRLPSLRRPTRPAAPALAAPGGGAQDVLAERGGHGGAAGEGRRLDQHAPVAGLALYSAAGSGSPHRVQSATTARRRRRRRRRGRGGASGMAQQHNQQHRAKTTFFYFSDFSRLLGCRV
jgi:hypothetical protein